VPKYDSQITNGIAAADIEKVARALFLEKASRGSYQPQDPDALNEIPGMVERMPAWRAFEAKALAALKAMLPLKD
jgi:hypothetical protein